MTQYQQLELKFQIVGRSLFGELANCLTNYLTNYVWQMKSICKTPCRNVKIVNRNGTSSKISTGMVLRTNRRK